MDVSTFKTVELRSKLEALGLDRKGHKRALVARLNKALNVLPASSILDTSITNGEETSTSQKTSQAIKQSSPRQSSSLTPEAYLPDAIREKPEIISETLEGISCEQQQITIQLNWNSNQNNWYNAFDEMDQSSIDIKEEILSMELKQAVHESKTSEERYIMGRNNQQPAKSGYISSIAMSLCLPLWEYRRDAEYVLSGSTIEI